MLKIIATQEELRNYGVFISDTERDIAEIAPTFNKVLRSFIDQKYLGEKIFFLKSLRKEGGETKTRFFFLPKRMVEFI